MAEETPAAGAPADGSTAPLPEAAPPAASEQAAAAPEPAVGSEDQASPGVTSESPPAPDETPPGAPEQRKPKRDRIQELIAEREFLREQLAKTTPAKAEPPKPEVPPKLEDFDTVEAWQQKYDEYSEARIERAIDNRLKKRSEEEQARALTEQFEARQQTFAEATPDYYEQVSDPSLQQFVTPIISEAIVTSEDGAKLSYYLATHRDELRDIARLRPAAQGVALGKLEAKLAAMPAPTPKTPAPAPKRQTAAPSPPSPVSANGAVTKDLESMSFADYQKHRAERWGKPSRR